MPANRISETDYFGRVYVRIPGSHPVSGYFETVEQIRPLVESEMFTKHMTGFYINVGEGLNSVRLSYFSGEPMQPPGVIRDFVTNKGLEQFKEEPPREVEVSKGYHGDELRFRKFLHLYTLIGLDLLNYDVLYSRRLVAEYRLTISPQRISCKPLFEPAFQKHSKTYKSLSDHVKEDLWRDLDFWHSGGDWAHMLVNMLLPGDWNMSDPWIRSLFAIPRGPIVGAERDQLLKIARLELPTNWSP